MKLGPVDVCNVFEMESQESPMGRKEILATFLPLKMTMAMNDFSHYLGQCETKRHISFASSNEFR